MNVEKIAPFTKSPLDAWRGSGREAKRLGLPVPFIAPPRELATITRLMTLGSEVPIQEPTKIPATTK